MKLNIFKFSVMSFAIAFAGFCAATASADYVEDFTTNQTTLFAFGAFVEGDTFNYTSEGLDVDIPSAADTFGAVAVAPTAMVDLSGVTEIQVTARLDAGNESPLILAVREGNGMGGDGEFLSYSIDASSFTEGSFVTVSVDPTAFFFNGDPADGVLNGPLNNTSIQTPFGAGGASFYTVASVTYVGASVVPEPTTAAVLLGLCPMFALRRRR